MKGSALLPEFDMEVANTRRMLEAIPDGELEYRPADKSSTLGELATHVANLMSWVGLTLGVDELDMAQPFERPQPKDREEILALLDRTAAEARVALESATEEQMASPWTLRTGDQVHFTMPKGVVLRSFVFNHLVHHRGQLVVYLRLLGQKVPGMYGPSADEVM